MNSCLNKALGKQHVSEIEIDDEAHNISSQSLPRNENHGKHGIESDNMADISVQGDNSSQSGSPYEPWGSSSSPMHRVRPSSEDPDTSPIASRPRKRSVDEPDVFRDKNSSIDSHTLRKD